MIDPLIGQTFGQYELQDRIGRGGMAAVYRAVQPALGRSVAVKVLPLAQLPDPTLPERFRREARLAANLMHPNIVPVYDFGEWQGYLYIVMALIAGGTLKDRLQGPMPVESAVRLVSQVADALGYAHGQGIFHRDVKPANVLLAAGDWAMLSDFGIARALGETTRLTSPYGTIGTPAYMAPEQWLGGDVDGRADLYSLGIVLYELLAGRPPFTATTSQGLMRQHLETPVPPLPTGQLGLPTGFDDVLQTALAKQPDQRYRHAGELKAALEAVMRQGPALTAAFRTDLAGSIGPVTTSPDLGQTLRAPLHGIAPSTSDPHPQPGRHVPTAVAVLVLVLVVLLAGAVGYIVAGALREPRSATPPTPTIASAVAPPTTAPTPQPAAPTATTAVAPPAAKVATEAPTPAPPTATPLPPPTSPAPPSPATALPPPPIVPPTAVQPTAPAKPAPTAASATDQRLALVERHVGDYFAALNAGDYARAQAVCCTPSWRSRYPLDDWRKNFTGVTDLRFTVPFRYTTVEPGRIVAEVDYSFANSSGTRQFLTLRWTFVPVGGDWLADDAVAFRQR